MGKILSSDLSISFILIVLFFAILYVLSIIWVIRDAYSRGANYKMWGFVALIPFIGVIVYLMLRPQLLLIDKDEQELEIAIKKRELLKYGECAKCGYPVESSYVVCPNCTTRLKNLCHYCNRPLDYEWKACPWCGGSAKLKSGMEQSTNYATKSIPKN